MQRDLSNSRRDLQTLENSNSKMEGEVNQLNLKLVKVESVANTREKDLAELRDELNRERQKLLVERLKRQDAETRTAMTESAYKELVEHNSKTQQENTRLVQENARIAAEKIVENNQKKSQTPELAILAPVTVFERYSGSLLRVENLITEKKLFGERGQKLASFYPAVDFGNNRIMIAGASHRFAGDWLDALNLEVPTTIEEMDTQLDEAQRRLAQLEQELDTTANERDDAIAALADAKTQLAANAVTARQLDESRQLVSRQNEQISDMRRAIDRYERVVGDTDTVHEKVSGIVRPYIDQTGRQADETLSGVQATLDALLAQLGDLQNQIDQGRRNLQYQKADNDSRLAAALDEWVSSAQDISGNSRHFFP